MKTKRRGNGFTLIELLVVLVILGLSVSVVAPDMFKMLERVQKRQEQTTISATLKLIKEKSFFSPYYYFITFKENRFSVYEYLAEKGLNSEQELALVCETPAEVEQTQTYNEYEDEVEANNKENTEEQMRCSMVKHVDSQFYTFEELSFIISGGKVDDHQFIQFFESNPSPSFTLDVY